MVVETGIRSIDQPVLDGLWTITLGSSTRFHSRKHHQALLVPDPVPVSQPQPPGGNRHTQPKCNAHVGEGTITPAVSIDNFVTFFLFLTFDYISLHQTHPDHRNFAIIADSRGLGHVAPRIPTKNSRFLADGRRVPRPFRLTVADTTIT
jgi:hypothetical protein